MIVRVIVRDDIIGLHIVRGDSKSDSKSDSERW
jgi:hypothetical protein